MNLIQVSLSVVALEGLEEVMGGQAALSAIQLVTTVGKLGCSTLSWQMEVGTACSSQYLPGTHLGLFCTVWLILILTSK